MLLFDCYIYLGLHEKCKLAQLALFNITTFYPSETFICKVCFFGKTLFSSDLWRQSWWTNFKLPAQRQGVINWGSPSCGEEWNYKKDLTSGCFVLKLSTQSFIQSKSNSSVALDKNRLMMMAVMIDAQKALRYLVIFSSLSTKNDMNDTQLDLNSARSSLLLILLRSLRIPVLPHFYHHQYPT